MDRNDPSVIEREREFHNARFADDEAREAQGKYYFAIRDCDEEYERLLLAHGKDAVVLDYGCAFGDYALRLAPIAKAVHGIDISDVAIESARAEAKAKGFLFQFAARDHYIAAPRAEAFIAAAPLPKGVFWYDTGHALAVPDAFADRQAWLAEKLFGAR